MSARNRIHWLLARRVVQVGLTVLFVVGSIGGIEVLRGSLSASELFGAIPLADPFLVLQALAARHPVASTALIGAGIVAVAYALLGGRVYCGWICPMNIVTDAAAWLRRRLGLRSGQALPRSARLVLLGGVFGAALVTGSAAYEWFNPTTLLHRGLVFGMGVAWFAVAGVFLLDLAVAPRGWCGHLCPMGTLFSWIGARGVLHMTAPRRARCDQCMECYAVCPEPQVIGPALTSGGDIAIRAGDCSRCGRCAEVCAEDVFEYRFGLLKGGGS